MGSKGGEFDETDVGLVIFFLSQGVCEKVRCCNRPVCVAEHKSNPSLCDSLRSFMECAT